NHSVMNYNVSTYPFTLDNTLFEPTDWSDMLCNLGGLDSTTGTAFSACTLNSSPGTTVGVAANGGTDPAPTDNVLSINGTATGSDVRVTNSYREPADYPTQLDSSSTLHVLVGTGD